jgi:DNA polymerase elongation subunit (family B)
MKREAIGAGTFCGKKRYTMYVFDNENKRYDEPELKIIGLEAVRSTTPKYFRDMMKVVYKMMYTHDEADVHQKVKEVYEEYMKLPLSG